MITTILRLYYIVIHVNNEGKTGYYLSLNLVNIFLF